MTTETSQTFEDITAEDSNTQDPTQDPSNVHAPRIPTKPERYVDEDLKKAYDENDSEHFYYAIDVMDESDDSDVSMDESDNEYDYDSDNLREFVVSDDEKYSDGEYTPK